MKAETYLDALLKAEDRYWNYEAGSRVEYRSFKQRDKFEAALRRKLAEQERRINELEALGNREDIIELLQTAMERGECMEFYDKEIIDDDYIEWLARLGAKERE